MNANEGFDYMKYWMALVTWLLGISLLAEVPVFNFIRLSSYENLSSLYISSMAQDSDRYIWIGTNDGVNRFDGANIKVYKAFNGRINTGLPSGIINTIFVDSKNRIWVGTPLGVSVYDREYDRFHILASTANRNGLSDKIHVNQILEDGQGNVILVVGNGFYRFDEERNSFELLFSSGARTLSQIYFDKKGGFWVGYKNGYGIEYYETLDSLKPKWSLFYAPEDISGLSNMWKMACYKGELWVAMGARGIAVVNSETGQLRRHFVYENNSVFFNLKVDDQGRLWAFDYKGMRYYDSAKDEFILLESIEDGRGTIRANVRDLFVDSQGNYYTIHNGDGVFVDYRQRGFKLYDTSEKSKWHLTKRNIYALTVDGEGNLWLGGYSDGIDVFKWKENKVVRYDSTTSRIEDKSILFLYRDSRGSIWTSSYMNGLKKFDNRKNDFRTWVHSEDPYSLVSNDVRSVLEDEKGNFWVATHGGGIDYFEVDKNLFRHFRVENSQLNSDWVNEMVLDKDGVLWVATSYGVSTLAPGDSVFKQYIPDFNSGDGLKGSNELSILIDHKGVIWVGGDQGLFYFDEQIADFVRIENLPVNYVASIEEDKNGNLWLGTLNGLLLFDRSSNLFYHFTEADGLQGSNFNPEASFYDPITNTMYFGGTMGVNAFNPDEIVFNQEAPNIRFTGFFLFNQLVNDYGKGHLLEKEINYTEEIVLDYHQNYFGIEFSALNFINPETNEYATMLEGFDSDWNYIGSRRSAFYSNLNPGRYIFRVKAANNDGVWNEEGINLKIRVLPPWWMSVWFFVILGFLLISSIIWFLRYRTANLRRRSIRLAHLVEEQTSRLRRTNSALKQRTVELHTTNHLLEERQVLILNQSTELREQSAKLKQSNKELIKLIATRDKLLSIIAHDLRTPFNTILGFTQILTEVTDLKDFNKVKKYVRYVHDSSLTVFNLLENMLFWVRSQSDKIRINPASYDLDEAVTETIELVRESALKKSISIDASDYHNYRVYADVDMIRIVIRNLLINAIKFTPADGFIKVKTSLESDFVHFYVIDSGVGMSPEDLKNLTANMTINSKPGTAGETGSGLGLSLCYEFVHRNGGEMSISSNLGKGSSFSFTIPLAK
ncbi:ligand-binding sensor domain-containing protein [Geofilum sp. OHC36d9]|uniref:ligand-binding sensor domain-containing protein n=1 Tax=Geofilum sp. OHC36d9 TaxID=3458413 RepID=UPI004033C8EE